jgi:hypothetical protein
LAFLAAVIKEIYEAFVEVGPCVETAGEAATALVIDDALFNSVDPHFNGINLRLKQVRGEQIVIRWITAFNLAFTLAFCGKLSFKRLCELPSTDHSLILFFVLCFSNQAPLIEQ